MFAFRKSSSSRRRSRSRFSRSLRLEKLEDRRLLSTVPHGEQFRVAETGPAADADFDVAGTDAVHLSPGYNLAVWVSGDDAPGPTEVFMQAFASGSGLELGPDVQVSPAGGSDVDLPSVQVGASGDGQALVVWQEVDDVFGRIVTAAGPVGATFEVSGNIGNTGPGAVGHQEPQGVAYNPDLNEYFVIWDRWDPRFVGSSTDDDVFGQRIDAATQELIGNPTFIAGDNVGEAGARGVVYDPVSGEYLVLYRGETREKFRDDVFVARVRAATGELVQNNINLSLISGDNRTFNSHIVYNSLEREAAVIWSETDPSAAYGTTLAFDGNQYVVGTKTNFDAGLLFRDFTFDAARNQYLATWGTSTRHLNPDLTPEPGSSFPDDFPFSSTFYDPASDEYVFVGAVNKDDPPELPDGKFEVFGRRVDPETLEPIGLDNFRLSEMGPPEGTQYDGTDPDVAYDPTRDRFLVVYSAVQPTSNGGHDIWGQFVDAGTGLEIGEDFPISTMGAPDNNSPFIAINPAVAYDPTSDRYLVVWSGENTVAGEFEIYGKILPGPGGLPSQFRISHQGPDGDPDFDALFPDVAFSTETDQFLVVWEGDGPIGLWENQVDNEFEIYSQLVDVNGRLQQGVGQVSDVGLFQDPNFDAGRPAVAYDPNTRKFLVVYNAEDAGVDGEFEIYAQAVLDFSGGTTGGSVRVSQAGADGDTNADAFDPAIAYHPASNEFLVAWRADPGTGGLANNEFEIFAQRVYFDSGISRVRETGPDDFRVSQVGLTDGLAGLNAGNPTIAADGDGYLIAYAADGDFGRDVLGQRIDTLGGKIDGQFFIGGALGILSDHNAFSAAAASDGENALVVWEMDDAQEPLQLGKFDIFGRFVEIVPSPPAPPELPDLVGRTAGGNWWLGVNTSTAFENLAFGQWAPIGWQDVSRGDVDGDGMDDVVGRTPAGEWWVGLNRDGGFENRLWGFWSEAADWRDVHVLDLDGDDDTDIVGRASNGDWWAGINDGAQFVNQLWGNWSEAAGWNDVFFATSFFENPLPSVVGRTDGGEWWMGANFGDRFENAFLGSWAPIEWHDVTPIQLPGNPGERSLDIVGRTDSGEWWALETTAPDGLPSNRFVGHWAPIVWNDVMRLDEKSLVGRTDGGDWWMARYSDATGELENTHLGNWAPFDWRDVQVADIDADGDGDILGRTPGGEWWVGRNENFLALDNALYGFWSGAAGWQDVMTGDFRDTPAPAGETGGEIASSEDLSHSHDDSAELALAAELARLAEDDERPRPHASAATDAALALW